MGPMAPMFNSSLVYVYNYLSKLLVKVDNKIQYYCYLWMWWQQTSTFCVACVFQIQPDLVPTSGGCTRRFLVSRIELYFITNVSGCVIFLCYFICDGYCTVKLKYEIFMDHALQALKCFNDILFEMIAVLQNCDACRGECPFTEHRQCHDCKVVPYKWCPNWISMSINLFVEQWAIQKWYWKLRELTPHHCTIVCPSGISSIVLRNMLKFFNQAGVAWLASTNAAEVPGVSSDCSPSSLESSSWSSVQNCECNPQVFFWVSEAANSPRSFSWRS